MGLVEFLIIFLLVFIALVPVSMLVEKMRPAPTKPATLEWAADIEPLTVDVDGVNIRYIRSGEGPPLLLLHTLRTQLDIFQKMVTELSRDFTVYAPDYPGHGWSGIPDANYDADFFVHAVDRFMEKLGLEDVLVAGVSIGGSIPLMSAGRGNNRIKGIVAINPYDYPGKGPARGNLLANLLFSIVYIPVLGETFMRFRNRLVEGRVMAGGVFDTASLPPAFLEEMFVVGERPGHLTAFINLIRHSASFCKAHNDYKNISVPVTIVYGDEDWAREEERKATVSSIPGAKVETIENAGHFLSLEHPQRLVEIIREFENNSF